MELAGSPGDPCAGYMVEDSDLEYSDCSEGESSDNEGCSPQYNLQRSDARQELSSEDEFEREMAGEVLSAMKLMVSQAAIKRETGGKRVQIDASSVGSSKSSNVPASEVGNSSKSSSGHSQFYDQVYFDSDDESSEEGEANRTEADAGSSENVPTRRRGSEARKVKKLSNDELFYDPNMDDEDEKWMNRKRMAYHNVKVSQQLEQKKKARLSGRAPPRGKNPGRVRADEASVPKSDAVLNCPACMTTLCIDCQRHDTYPNQYRAMFVLNCRVMKDEVLKYVPKPSKKSRKRAKGMDKLPEAEQSEASPDSQEVEGSYHPVRCAECNTEIAVLDSAEVYHFFNVLPSAPS